MLRFGLNTTMFKENKYTKIYTMIANRAKTRILDVYKEKHHIYPQSLGGSNKKENLVWLTAREHFICHWLLVKMTEGEDRSKMIYALQGMKASNKYQDRYHTKITSRVYEKYREEHAKNHSSRMKGRKAWNKGGAVLTDEQRKRISDAAKNRAPKSKETIDKWKKSRAGYKHSTETKIKQSTALKGKPKGPQSEEHRLAISLGGKGIKKREGHCDNVRKANLGNISINKDGIEKKIKRDMLDEYLQQGWQLGGRKRVINLS